MDESRTDRDIEKENKIKSSLFFNSRRCIIIITVTIIPLIFSIATYPQKFGLSWNEGRGGFIFAIAFVLAETISLKLQFSVRKLFIIAAMVGVSVCYFVMLSLGLSDFLIVQGHNSHVWLIDSWRLMWDFLVMTIYILVSLVVLFGRHWYMIAPAGVIYLAGSTAILFLDSFFPYDTLGPLQAIVPTYLQIDQSIIQFIGDHIVPLGSNVPALAKGNLLFLNGPHGEFILQVFWPSAGVHSMIIYNLVMTALLLKMKIPRERKLVYLLLGVLGTAAMNIIRIISLSLYALVVTTKVNDWEAFHSLAGELMFLPWLGIYLFVVIYMERKLFIQIPRS